MGLIYRWEPFAGAATPGMRLRQEVFLWEQHFSYDYDQQDTTALHLTFLDEEGRAVAAARLLPDPGDTVHFGRVVVSAACRGQALGRLLMAELERAARGLGYTRAVVGAQRQAEGFYLRCGYQPTGLYYEEEGCPHVEMEKELTAGQE